MIPMHGKPPYFIPIKDVPEKYYSNSSFSGPDLLLVHYVQ